MANVYPGDLAKVSRDETPLVYPWDIINSAVVGAISAGSVGTLIDVVLADATNFPRGSVSGKKGVVTVVNKNDPLDLREELTWESITGNTLVNCTRRYGRSMANGDYVYLGVTGSMYKDIVSAIETLHLGIEGDTWQLDKVNGGVKLKSHAVNQTLSARNAGDSAYVPVLALEPDGTYDEAALTWSMKGEANGLAELDNTGKIPAGQIPARLLTEVVVDAGGDGDYTSILAAFTAEGAARYTVKSSSTETSDVTVPDGSIVNMQGPTITVNGCEFIASTNGSYVYGSFTLTGTGEAVTRRLFNCNSSTSNNKWGACDILVKPIGDGLTDGSGGTNYTALLEGTNNEINIRLDTSLSYNCANETWCAYANSGGLGSKFSVEINCADNSGAGDLIGCRCKNTKGTVELNINGVTVSGSGDGYGIEKHGSSTYALYTGVVRDCDTNEFGAFGTGFNVAGLIT